MNFEKRLNLGLSLLVLFCEIFWTILCFLCGAIQLAMIIGLGAFFAAWYCYHLSRPTSTLSWRYALLSSWIATLFGRCMILHLFPAAIWFLLWSLALSITGFYLERKELHVKP